MQSAKKARPPSPSEVHGWRDPLSSCYSGLGGGSHTVRKQAVQERESVWHPLCNFFLQSSRLRSKISEKPLFSRKRLSFPFSGLAVAKSVLLPVSSPPPESGIVSSFLSRARLFPSCFWLFLLPPSSFRRHRHQLEEEGTTGLLRKSLSFPSLPPGSSFSRRRPQPQKVAGRGGGRGGGKETTWCCT